MLGNASQWSQSLAGGGGRLLSVCTDTEPLLSDKHEAGALWRKRARLGCKVIYSHPGLELNHPLSLVDCKELLSPVG